MLLGNYSLSTRVIKLPLFGGTNKGNRRKEDESHTTNSKWGWMSWEPVGDRLAAEAPFSSQYRHCGRANHACKVRCDPIWRYQMKRNASYEHLWKRIAAASNLNLPFSPIVSSCLWASGNPISLQDREDGNIPGAHLAPISSRSHPRWKQCWVQQVKNQSHTHTRHTCTWKPPQTSKGSPSWNFFADL